MKQEIPENTVMTLLILLVKACGRFTYFTVSELLENTHSDRNFAAWHAHAH